MATAAEALVELPAPIEASATQDETENDSAAADKLAAQAAMISKAVAAADQQAAAFECNVCLELASEPVVTLCGHLYCWPCLYR